MVFILQKGTMLWSLMWKTVNRKPLWFKDGEEGLYKPSVLRLLLRTF
jgi:hypothetical protein